MRQTAVTQSVVTEMFQSPFHTAPSLSGLHTPSSSPSRPATMVCPPSPARASPTQEISSRAPRGSGECPEAASLDRVSQGCGPANEAEQTSRNRNSVRGRATHSAGQRELAEEEVDGPVVRRESMGCIDANVNGGDVLHQSHQKGNNPSLSFTSIASLNSSDLVLQGQGCICSSPLGRLDNIPVQSCNSTSKETRNCLRKDSLEKLVDTPLTLETLGVAVTCHHSPGDVNDIDPAISHLDNHNDTVTFIAGDRDNPRLLPCFQDNTMYSPEDDVRNGNLCSDDREMFVNDNSGKVGATQRRLERLWHGFLDNVKIGCRREAQNEANLMRFHVQWGPSDNCDFPQVYNDDMDVDEEISAKLDRPEFVRRCDLTNGLPGDDMDGSSDEDEAVTIGKMASTLINDSQIVTSPACCVIQPFYKSLTSFGSLRLANGTRRDGRANPHLALAIERSGSTGDDSPQVGQMLPLEYAEHQANTPAAPKDFGSPPTLCSELGEVPAPLKPEARLGTGKAAPAASPFLLPPIWTPLALQALQDSAHRVSNLATSQGNKVVTTVAIDDKARAQDIFLQELPRFSDVVSEEGLSTPKACGHSGGRRDVGKWSRGGRVQRCEGELPENRGNSLKRALYLRVAGTGGGGGTGAFEEALLDDECSLFSCRFTSSLLRDISVVDRGLQDPVAATLQQGDDMHFIPIREETSRPAPLQGSAFTCYTPL